MKKRAVWNFCRSLVAVSVIGLLWSCAADQSEQTPDTIGPKVLSSQDNTTIVGTSELTLQFSEEMSGLTANKNHGTCEADTTIKLTNLSGTCYALTIAPLEDNRYTIKPQLDLVTGSYKLTLGTGIKDLSGNSLVETVISFQVEDALTTVLTNLEEALEGHADKGQLLTGAREAGSKVIKNNLINVIPAVLGGAIGELNKLSTVDYSSTLTLIIDSLMSTVNGAESLSSSASRSMAAIASSAIIDLLSSMDSVVFAIIPGEEIKNYAQAKTLAVSKTGVTSAELATIIKADASQQVTQLIAVAANRSELDLSTILEEVNSAVIGAILSMDSLDPALATETTQAVTTVISASESDEAKGALSSIQEAADQLIEAATGDTGGETTGDTGGETTGDTGGETTGDTGGSTTGGSTTIVITPATGTRSCSLDGTPVGHQSSITAYLTASVPFGETCQTETRSCIDGSLSGSYAFASCTEEPAPGSTPALGGSVQTFGDSSSSRTRGRSAAATASSSISVNQPVKSLVSLYLLVDEDFTYPVAKVKSAADGSYEVTAGDVKDFLLNPPSTGLEADYGYLLPTTATITDASTDEEIIAAFETLGTLQVRALYIKEGQARVISAMADPGSDEPVRVDPIVQRVAQQIISALQETIKETITALAGLSDEAKREILANVESVIESAVAEELENVASQTTFEVPEGTDLTDPEALLDVEMDVETATELREAIENESEEITLETTKLAVEDKGKLGDTLSDEQKGAFAKKSEAAASNVTSKVSAGASSLSDAERAALEEKAKQIKAKSLRKFFLTLGFPVVLAEGADNTSVVALSLKVPSNLEDTELPGAATFSDRSVRHFLIKGTDSSTAPTGWENAPVLATQVDTLLDNLSGYVSEGEVDENALLTADREDLLDRVRVFHRFEATLAGGMPLVSQELVDWMVDYDNKTITVQQVATRIAEITEWRQKSVEVKDGILPIFSEEFSAPTSGSTVKASSLITALTRPLDKDAATTARQLTDGNENFWIPFTADALKQQIMRNAESLDFEALLPASKDDYLLFLQGQPYTTSSGNTNQVPPSPSYLDARATIARGLVAALPDDAYSTASQKKNLNGQTPLNAKQAVFFITYLLELQFAVEKSKGLMIVQDGKLSPNYQNFKHLNFSSEVGVAEVIAPMLIATAPTESTGASFAQEAMRSGILLVGSVATDGMGGLLLPENKQFDATEIKDADGGATFGEPLASTELSCTVQMFDDSTPKGLSVSLLQYDAELDEFALATERDNVTAIYFTTSDNLSFTASNVPTDRDYAIRFTIESYRNEIPELRFPLGEYSAELEVCGGEDGFIGPDVEDEPLPAIGLVAASSTAEAIGLDFGNYIDPVKVDHFMLFADEDQVNGGSEGTRELMLLGEPGGSYQLEAGEAMGLARVSKVDRDFSLTTGNPISGIQGMFNQSLDAIIGSNFSGSSSVFLSPNEKGDLGGDVYLLEVSDQEYWLLELDYLDVEFGILELSFARINNQSRAEIPVAGFEQGPVDREKARELESYVLHYGDGLCLAEGCQERYQSAVNFGEIVEIEQQVDFRYAGDDFLEKIGSGEDLESYYEDASSIPVRLDGRGSTNFVKLNFDRQKGTYTMSKETTSATGIKHNDVLGVCLSGDWNSQACPNYIMRVVRTAPAGDLLANQELELQLIRFAEPGVEEDYRKAVIGSARAEQSYPQLIREGWSGAEVVFDGDFDGVPWLFDPNDEDSNIPGGISGDAASDLSIRLVNKYEYSGNQSGGLLKRRNPPQDNTTVYSSRLLIATEGIYLGDIDKITLSSPELGLSDAILATCQPAREELGEFVEAQCTLSEAVASGLRVKPAFG